MKLTSSRRPFPSISPSIGLLVLASIPTSRGLVARGEQQTKQRDAITVSIAPEHVVVPPHGSQRFLCRVLGTEDQRVTWDVRDSRGELSPAGTITPDGIYTPGASGEETVSIRATSAADPSSFATASVVFPDKTTPETSPEFPEENFEGADASVVATSRFRIHYRGVIEDDAVHLHGWLDDSFTALTKEFGERGRVVVPELPVVDVYLHTQECPLAGPGLAMLLTGSENGRPTAALHMLALSLTPATARTMIDEPQDETYFRRVLSHEISTLFLEAIARSKPAGWRLSQAPGWFLQGYEEYLGLHCSTERARSVTAARYREIVAKDPERIGSGLVVTNDYLDGAVLLAFLHERYGKEKVQRLLMSPAPTFDAALSAELGASAMQLTDEFRAWLAH